jgi:flagellar biosynthetic protein FliR
MQPQILQFQLPLFLNELLRCSTAVAIVGLPGFRQLSTTTRSFLAFTLATICYCARSAEFALAPAPPQPSLIPALISGAIIGFLWNGLLEATSLAMQLVGIQSGMNYASIIDPSNNSENGALGSAAQLALMSIFLSSGLHLEFLQLLIASDQVWSADLATLQSIPTIAKSLLRLTFRCGLQIALPFLMILLLLDAVAAFAAKIAERFQLSANLFPLKWVITIALLYLCAPALAEIQSRIAAQIFALRIFAVHSVALTPEH